MTCATCHVIVDAEWADRLPPPSRDEDAMLEMTAAARQHEPPLVARSCLRKRIDGSSRDPRHAY
jgi:2Fe-2S ferredoxin